MTSREKRFNSIIECKLKTYHFADIRIFLGYYEFSAELKGGSHCIFRRNPYPHITIVVHHDTVDAVYVKRMVKVLKEYEILK